ncbi:MAG: DUF5668 domain-containing protein [Patescibacteria group bacterium]
MKSSSSQGMGCHCPHHHALPVLVILFGLTFLLQAFGLLTDTLVGYIWPCIVIAAGLYKLISGVCSCCGGKSAACGGSCSTEGSCCKEEGEAHSHEVKK